MLEYLTSPSAQCLVIIAGVITLCYIEWGNHKKRKAYKRAKTLADLGHRFIHTDRE